MSEGEYELKSTKYDKAGYREIIKGILPQRNPQGYTGLALVLPRNTVIYLLTYK